MYFWNSYPFIRLSIALILGIVIYEYIPTIWNFQYTLLLSLFCIYGALVIISHRYSFYKLRHLNGFFALLLIAFIGGFQTKLVHHSHISAHYKNITFAATGFSGTINSPVNERTNYYRYALELHSVVGDSLQKTYGKIHLYVRKDSSSSSTLSYGDQIFVKGSFYPVPGPDNPKEFDYKKYLERQNIYAHSFVESKDIKIIAQSPPNRLFSFAYTTRAKAVEVIDKHIPEMRENAVSKALLLGIKDFLDNDLKQAYASAGAMHVLAVSGLHVGIVYLILQLLLGKLSERGNLGKISFGILSVSLIWFYAIVTGLSPSVLRAATMFSAVALSKVLAKDSNIYNTLGIAAFILLLKDPYLIYSVGFQLSFAAVFGIVYLQPKLYRLISFRYVIIDKAWAITCVSLSAQLATFPLSAYYFHQFPTYFLISNLVVIPCAFLLLLLGVGMLLIDPLLPIVGSWLGRIIYFFMWAMNEIIAFVEKLTMSLVEWIYLDESGLLMTYAIIISLVAGLHFKSFRTLVVTSLLGVIFLGTHIRSHILQSKQRQLIFYEVKDQLAIDYINGHKAKLYIDNYRNTDVELLSFQIDPYRLSAHLRPTNESVFDLEDHLNATDVFRQGEIAGQKILIIDSTTFHLDFKKVIISDIIIINNGAVKNLKWLDQHFTYKYLIIGNNNSIHYSNRMKKQALEIGVNIHAMKGDGAFLMPLENKKRADNLPALFTTNPD